MTLKHLQKRFREIADAFSSSESLPLVPQYEGGAHAEKVGDSYFYVVTERGQEYERRETNDPEELLSWFVRDMTGHVARDWELKHRVRGTDGRRGWFKKHVELLSQINESWAAAQEDQYKDVLSRHPFDDSTGDRSDYYDQLQEQGISYDEAWRLALLRYPEPEIP